MKKLIGSLALMLISTVSYAKTYECTGHFEGAQVGKSIQVNASKASVAETKAYTRLKKAGLKVEYTRCKE